MKAKAVKSKTKGMFRVKYPDGVLSQDHYNLSWAKHHVKDINGEYRKGGHH